MNVTFDKCAWCGLIHEVKCPLIKSVEYQDDGRTIKRIEFFSPSDMQFIFSPISNNNAALR